jgi:hypothetical protein
MLHTFKDGFCTVCGESISYLIDNRYGETLGPKLAADPMQLEFPYTVDVFELQGALA